MPNNKGLIITAFILAIAGMIFSGYLTYNIYWSSGCSQTIISCGSNGNVVKIFGVPTCVYGFFMYLVVGMLLLFGLLQPTKTSWLKSAFIITIIGLIFSLSLSAYELWIKNTGLTGLPACVYGFFIYLGIFILGWLALSKKKPIQA